MKEGYEQFVSTYWGCTTLNCDRGFGGSPHDKKVLPLEWSYCPSCGGELTMITLKCERIPA